MIAKSDLIILVVSAGALAAGVYRWQQNMTQPPLATTNVRVVVGTPPDPPVSAEDLVASAPRLTTASSEADARPIVRRLPADDVDEAATDGTTAPGEPTVGGTRAGGRRTETESSPDEVTSEASVSIASERGGEALYGVYRVEEGDYLGRIAERFGTSVRTLRSINGIEGSKILIGQEIRYPLPAN